MKRRGFFGALLGLFGIGAAGKAAEPVDRESLIDGVGVLRMPQGFFTDENGKTGSYLEVADRLAATIKKGSILILPNNRDEYGDYAWDFRIEGGDPGQVEVKRADE